MSSVNFFGHIVVPKNAYKHVPPEGTMLHISQAALASDCSEGRNSLQVTVDEKTFTLCTLEKAKCENAFLNLNFGVGQEFTLQMVGESPIHITGYYEVILDDEDEFSDEEEADYIRAYNRALGSGADDDEINSDEADDEDMSEDGDDQIRMMMEQDFADDEDEDEDEDDFRPVSSVMVEDVTDKKRKGAKALPPPAKKPKVDEAAPKKEQQQPAKKDQGKKEQQQQPKKEEKSQTPAKKEHGKKDHGKKEQQPKTPEQEKQDNTPGSSGKKKNRRKNKKNKHQQQ